MKVLLVLGALAIAGVVSFFIAETLVPPPPPPGHENSAGGWTTSQGPVETCLLPPCPKTGPPSGSHALLVLDVRGLREGTPVLICAQREGGFRMCFNIVREGNSSHELWLEEGGTTKYDIWVEPGAYRAEPSSYTIRVKPGDQVILEFRLSTG